MSKAPRNPPAGDPTYRPNPARDPDPSQEERYDPHNSPKREPDDPSPARDPGRRTPAKL